MSEFTKVYSKWHAQNNRKYDSAIKYHKALMKNFKDWQPPKKLVEVPQFVADWFEENKGNLDYKIWEYINDSHEISDDVFWQWFIGVSTNPFETLIRMKLDGYTVKKEQLYYLCEKNTGYYLNKKGDSLKLVVNPYFDENNEFTQSEIDELHIGSYKQIEVEP